MLPHGPAAQLQPTKNREIDVGSGSRRFLSQKMRRFMISEQSTIQFLLRNYW